MISSFPFFLFRFDKTMITMKYYKPGILIMLKLKFDIKVNFFVCEIKKPGCSSNKHETDFVKVQREMKAIIDQQIDLGVNNPVCYDLLVEGKHSLQHKFCQKAHCELLGYDCYLYQMSLKYEAEYRSRLIA